IDSIPIANMAVRLRHLDRQLSFFAGKNAAGIVMQLCEAAAKELGGAFTNERKHKMSGPNGEPLPAPVHGPVIVLPDNGRGDVLIVQPGKPAENSAGAADAGADRGAAGASKPGDPPATGTADKVPGNPG
ncbi:MAG: hypothetical protein ACREQD_16305, partial [Candidatus Binataceae bacterium]